MNGKVLLVLILALLLVPAGVSAAIGTTTITAENVNQYSFTAGQGLVIYEIIIDSLPVGANQTHILNAGGATFLLSIETAQSWGIYNDFWVTMIYPDGSNQTVHQQVARLSDGNYKTKIQPVFSQLQSLTVLWQIELNIGTRPLTVIMDPWVDDSLVAPMYNRSSSVPFTSVSGEFGGHTSTVFVYEISRTGFNENIAKYNPFGSLQNWLEQVTAWTWEGVLEFINMIPIIGPMFLTVIGFIGSVGGKIIFWIWYIFTHFYLVFAGIEILITMFAYLNTGKRASAGKIISKWADYNITVVKGFLWILGWIFDKLMMIVQVVNAIIKIV